MINFDIEDKYSGLVVAGVDEAGRGPLAGPIVAGAVIIDRNYYINSIDDSKKLKKQTREKLYQEITGRYSYATGIISPEEIDEINILEATKKACLLAVSALNRSPDIVLVDGNMKFQDPRFVSIIKGDSLSYSIASASIIAKVTRDNIMNLLAKDFPNYHWHQNVGYGTKVHIEAIYKHGITSHHRQSFKIKG